MKKVRITGKYDAEKVWKLVRPKLEEVLQKIVVEFPELEGVLALYLADIKARLAGRRNGKDTVIFYQDCPEKSKEILVGQLVLKAARFFTAITVNLEDTKNAEAARKEVLATPIMKFAPGVKLGEVVRRLNVKTVADLIEKTEEQLLNCEHFGPSGLASIRDKLAQHGLKLSGD